MTFGRTTVSYTNATYRTLSQSSSTGWFSSGQNASILLSGFGFNDTGGPLEFNHLAGVASDGTHLVVSDRNNNRVLIWNSIPTSPGTPPDLVLGQKTFYSNAPGMGLTGMDWPTQVSIGGGKLVVADTYNNRILIWNTFPTYNDQPADLEIAAPPDATLSSPLPVWPWGVWTDGSKLAVSSTSTSQVLVWNTFQTSNNQTPDFYLNAGGGFGTPRQITSNGKYLMVGDHNPFSHSSGGALTQPGSFVWDTFPTGNTPDTYFLPAGAYLGLDPNGQPRQGYDWFRGAIFPNGTSVLMADTIYLFKSFPLDNRTKPETALSFPNSESYLNLEGIYSGGDGSDVAIAGSKIIVAEYNQNKILIFNSIPKDNFTQPDLVIGAQGLFNNSLSEHYFVTNPIPLTNGKSLFVASDFDAKLSVYKSLPNQSGAYPDIVYNFNRTFTPWSGALFNNTLALVGGQQVEIWKNLPLHGELPDVTFSNKIGNVAFSVLQGVAMDSKHFFLADSQAGKLYVWDGMPSNTTNPSFTLSTITAPSMLSDDGNFLVVTQTEGASAPGQGGNGAVWIYNLSTLSQDSKPVAANVSLNLPHDAIVAFGHLFIGDIGHNRVLIWKNISDAIKGMRPNEILGCTTDAQNCNTPKIGKNALFWPSDLAFDGAHLWVGEFKFSERLLRFDIS